VGKVSKLRLLALCACLVLFIARVTGQVYVGLYRPNWLPPWEQWYSGLLPYPALLQFQIVLILLMGLTLYDLIRGAGWFHGFLRRHPKGFGLFDAVYFFAMVLRYAFTMGSHPEQRWFQGTLPIWFHMVLATFIWLCVDAAAPPRKRRTR